MLTLLFLQDFLLRFLKKWYISISHRIINIHPSLIPSFCGVGFYGLHVHEAALAKGVKVTGATVHYVDEGMDTGEIIAQKACYGRRRRYTGNPSETCNGTGRVETASCCH